MKARHTVFLALVSVVAGCTRVGTPVLDPPGVAGESEVSTRSLAGVATLGGQRMRVVIEVTTDARGRGTSHLEIPDLDLTAAGSAQWRGDALELNLRYAGECPGEVRIRGKRAAGGSQFEGTIEAKDCTGDESGTVVLEVRTTADTPLSPGAGASSLPSGTWRL